MSSTAEGIADDALTARVAEVRGREALSIVWRLGPAMAVLLLVFAIYDGVAQPADERVWRVITDLAPAAVIGGILLAARRGKVTTENAGWFVVIGSLAVSVSVVVTAAVSGQVPYLVYPIIMTIVNGASALDARQFAASQSVPVIGSAAVILAVPAAVPPDLAGDWFAVLTVAVAASVAIHVARARGFREVARIQALLEQEAIEDPLTRLGTRRAFERMSPLVIESSEIAELPMFAVFIDVDGLKRVNDESGHDAGDRVLLAVAQAMRDSARSRDVLVRWGGDEFAVLGIGDPGAPKRWQDSVVQRVADLNPLPDLWSGTVSVGVAMTSAGATSPADLIRLADTAMYDGRRMRRSG